MAITPEKTLRYCSPTNVKLNAVTAGHNLQLFTKLIGTVLLIRSQTSGRVSPDNRACIPKKYELKSGVNASWLTTTLVARLSNVLP